MKERSDVRHVDGRPMREAHGYVWPNGAEAYGRRYIEKAVDLREAVMRTTGRGIAIQAGGNVGVWPIALVQAFGFRHVVTFEPEANNYRALCVNVMERAHGASAEIRTQADLNEAADLLHRGVVFPASMSTLRAYDYGLAAAPGEANVRINQKNIGGHKLALGAIASHGPAVRVTTIDDTLRLADIDDTVHLIQLDVEGLEHSTLLGAMETIEAHRPVIMIEERGHEQRHPGEEGFPAITKLLGRLGYRERARASRDVVFAC